MADFNTQDHFYSKDGINDYLVNRDLKAVNPNSCGTKAAALYQGAIPGRNGFMRVQLRLKKRSVDGSPVSKPFEHFTDIFERRCSEMEEFYNTISPFDMPGKTECKCGKRNALKWWWVMFIDHVRAIQRQAFAGLLWSKQFYHYVVHDWLNGDPHLPRPPVERRLYGKNKEWGHAHMEDILAMPDKVVLAALRHIELHSLY
jgi:hypothetical protein